MVASAETEVSASISFRYVKAFGLLLVGLGLLALHRYVAKLAGTNTATPLSHTRNLLRTTQSGSVTGASTALRKRRA